MLAFTATAGMLTVGYKRRTGREDHLQRNVHPARQRRSGDGARCTHGPHVLHAYFLAGANKTTRPIIFLYDAGPSVFMRTLLMESFGPVKVMLPDLQHPVGGPYSIQNNPDCLLDVADLVFIDAPGAGYSRIDGRNAAKSFYGIDQDAAAFDRFIRRFLSKYDRWDSPKYLFGHSYGTTRNAVLGWRLAQDDVDLNGIISAGWRRPRSCRTARKRRAVFLLLTELSSRW